MVQSADPTEPMDLVLAEDSTVIIDGATLKNVTFNEYYAADKVGTLSIENSSLEGVSGKVGAVSAFRSNSGSCGRFT